MASASTSTQQAPAQAGKSSTQQQPLIAQGDWTKNLVQLAKTAELKYVQLPCVSMYTYHTMFPLWT